MPRHADSSCGNASFNHQRSEFVLKRSEFASERDDPELRRSSFKLKRGEFASEHDEFEHRIAAFPLQHADFALRNDAPHLGRRLWKRRIPVKTRAIAW